MSTSQRRRVVVPSVVALLVSGVVAAAGGCAGGDVSVAPSVLESVSARAVVDRDSVTISLPLDKYGMSRSEQRIVAAGRGVLFYRCVTGKDELSAEALAALRTAMASTQTVPDWLFGYWNADYVAKHGIDFAPETWAALPPTGGSEEKEFECGFSDESQEMTPFDTSGATGSEVTLVGASSAANDAALADERFRVLRKQRTQCLAKAGYEDAADSQVGGVKFEDSWSGEERLRAMVAEATCNDQLEVTQKMADIQASYEQGYINTHQAELVAIRKEAERRIARAKELLEGTGLYAG